MKRLNKLWLKIYKYFSDMNLLRKLTLAYTIAILIPTIAMGVYTYKQSTNRIKQEMAQNAEKSLLQIKEDIQRKMIIVRGISNNIAFNTKIQNLLYYGMEFTPEALNYYIDSIATPIDYALNFSDANIYQIGVYYANDSIPEYNNFFKESKIKDEAWFNSFKSGSEDELWIYPAISKRFSNNLVNKNLNKEDKTDKQDKKILENTNVLKMVKKIRGVDGKYLGVVTVDILEEDIFSSMNLSIKSNEIFAVNNSEKIIYPANYEDKKFRNAIIDEDIDKQEGYFFDHNILYSYDTIKNLNIKIISKTPIDNLVRSSLMSSGYNILAVIIGVILLEIITYFILKMIFSRLYQIVNIMEIVAKGNFNIRIPVIHEDEVGKIAGSFNILIEKINDLINDVIKKETAQKDAQLTALQYQINPHFIYNTIDIFRMKLEIEGNYEMADSITYFGKMLRYNINRDSQYVTIGEEIDYIKKYINLQKLRYEDKLKLEVYLPEELENIKIIRFMLQPIIENSIKHGFKDIKACCTIVVSIERNGDIIEIQVMDNGNGIDSKELEALNDQLRNSKAMEKKNFTDRNIGLENINARIKLFYGEQYYITLQSKEGEYTNAIIRIPYVFD